MAERHDDHDQVAKDFNEAVNMAPAELEGFLDSDDSKRVGWKGEDGKGDGESVGHRSGRRIIELKRTKRADLTDEDYAHMKKVVGYVHRHLAQGGPAKDKEQSDWRYSLMNWGHDPLK
ncbi:DUF3140 domain-containing protein [Sphingomonas phyllosphaerae]|uniref:DUF3140 domain-containing protein n=1 Tax=Sphingomonas phyllosphaerae TaxID=257003 RepID=UPI00241349AB|nr:DUF3140 domain-containing protein [Sphingomonas phyllosphaerae]